MVHCYDAYMQSLDTIFAALSDETRREILSRLSSGETPLSELAAPLPMSQTAVSKHVRVLSDAQLVTVEKRGRVRYCRLNAEPMKRARDWINDYQTFWVEQMEGLGRFLAEEKED